MARGSAGEGAAIDDVLEARNALSWDREAGARRMLDRWVAILTKLGQRGYSVYEPTSESSRVGDSDPDNDTDTE